MENLSLTPIGVIESPYSEKFSVPRQPNLVSQGTGWLRLLAPYNAPDAVRGLEQFSHIWLIFHFHQIPTRTWHATVRPPRLGGNARVGVFASRATHRPNPLGLSKVALNGVQIENGEVRLKLGSLDLVDGTPIFDIKPYLAYADSEPAARSSFAQSKPLAPLTVRFSPEITAELTNGAGKIFKNFTRYGITDPLAFIREVIAQDPRPAYQQGKPSDRIYGMALAGFDVRWRIANDDLFTAEVLELNPLSAL